MRLGRFAITGIHPAGEASILVAPPPAPRSVQSSVGLLHARCEEAVCVCRSSRVKLEEGPSQSPYLPMYIYIYICVYWLFILLSLISIYFS